MSHRHVMAFIGSGVADNCTFLVLERITSTLSQSLESAKMGWFASRAAKKQWSLRRVLLIAEQLTQAMVYIHEEAYRGHALLHRDLKPDNIGFADDGRLLLFDFGLAKLLPLQSTDDANPVEMTGKTGSARYMAPEVALSRPYNTKADVHSFALIVYEMAAHEKPFSGMDLEMLYTDVIYGGRRPRMPKQWPGGFRDLLKDCWHPEASRRPTFREVLERLQQLLVQSGDGSDRLGKR